MISSFSLAPLQELERVRHEVSRLLGGWDRPSREPDGANLVRPAMTVREREDGYELTFDVPGVTADDIEIEANDRNLRIRAARGGPGQAFYIRYERVLMLPDDIDPEGMEAEFRNGVLHLSIKKRAQSGSRRIEVRGAPALAGDRTGIDPETMGLHETDGLRGSGSPPDYFGRPDRAERDALAGTR
jgi:HSP20 family protein